MREIKKEELKEILSQHDLWVESNGDKGDRADLIGANLNRATLNRANLSGANLNEANLSEANLNEANLIGANLNRATLNRANLSEANLSEANLSGADLIGATLLSGKKYESISKEQAHSLSIELWQWLKDNLSFNKKDWPDWEKYYALWPDLRGMECFLCIYYQYCNKCILNPKCGHESSGWKMFSEKNDESYDRIIKACVGFSDLKEVDNKP